MAFLWFMEIKGESHVGLGGPIGRFALGSDLGLPSMVPAAGSSVRISLDEVGWFGAEVLGAALPRTTAVLTRDRQVRGLDLRPGDVLRSDGSFVAGAVHYGYPFRCRVAPFGFPLGAFASPTLGVGLVNIDASVRRLAPLATTDLGRATTALGVIPGFTLGLELGVIRVGGDLRWALPGVKLDSSRIVEFENLRVFAVLRILAIEVGVGWRLFHAHLIDGDRKADLRLTGVDLFVTVSF